MKPSVYVETTVIGYLTARLQQDVIVLGHQIATRKWWDTAFDRFELFVSEVVVRECRLGDDVAVRERDVILQRIKFVQTTRAAETLAESLILGHAVPATEPEDALHIALAASHGLQYLVTWNCRHIANASIRASIERICRVAGFEAPVICTPEELLED